ncbi:hypothetical protein BGZ81_008368 [Podila clonocystis]|nr:hypothetical protein BGZ81_008368 [Podila clonocystis]
MECCRSLGSLILIGPLRWVGMKRGGRSASNTTSDDLKVAQKWSEIVHDINEGAAEAEEESIGARVPVEDESIDASVSVEYAKLDDFDHDLLLLERDLNVRADPPIMRDIDSAFINFWFLVILV